MKFNLKTPNFLFMPLYSVQQLSPSACLGLWKIDETVDKLLDMPALQRFANEALSRFSAGSRRQEWLSVRALLLAMEPETVNLSILYDLSGKPSLSDGRSISISHTKGWVSIIIGNCGPLGIDIEQTSNRVSRVVKRFALPDEPQATVREQLLLWSLKETVYKFYSEQHLDFFDIQVLHLPSDDNGIAKVVNHKSECSLDVAFHVTDDYVLTYASTRSITLPKAALFDLDGVVFDTEPQYSIFWGQECRRYHPEIPGLEDKIKGQTLDQIFEGWFGGSLAVEREAIVARLNAYEQQMSYNYVDGFLSFVRKLRARGVKTAVVTSSNHAKMNNVYAQHEEFKGLFDAILTSEDFSESKPSPDCYHKAAARFGFASADCVVFEDSFNGLRSGRSAGMTVVGLSTTNAPEAIAPFCYKVIPDYQSLEL